MDRFTALNVTYAFILPLAASEAPLRPDNGQSVQRDQRWRVLDRLCSHTATAEYHSHDEIINIQFPKLCSPIPIRKWIPESAIRICLSLNEPCTMAAAAQLGINQWKCWLAIIAIIAGEGWQYCISSPVCGWGQDNRYYWRHAAGRCTGHCIASMGVIINISVSDPEMMAVRSLQ